MSRAARSVPATPSPPPIKVPAIPAKPTNVVESIRAVSARWTYLVDWTGTRLRWGLSADDAERTPLLDLAEPCIDSVVECEVAPVTTSSSVRPRPRSGHVTEPVLLGLAVLSVRNCVKR
ncbi:hypothetical protein [Streptomyces halstedii]|uniref:hypothetical protein n=1 Tax=Streptomyces halstedii TaxID=1944 RepID=UPI0019442527|nr:hypothetical protein [Streptomyces halstedii]